MCDGRYTAKIAPVVVFFNAKGELLAEPLLGSMIPDFYGAYFDAVFNEAKSELRVTRPRIRQPSQAWPAGTGQTYSILLNHDPGLRPGLFGGTNPATRHNIPSVFLP